MVDSVNEPVGQGKLEAADHVGAYVLKTRTSAVLSTLVSEYIRAAAPVASEDIARRSSLRVSPATIRNEMAELEEEGYITRPHISSGGVPSDKGYRFYVESLNAERGLPEGLQHSIRDEFGQVQRDVEAWIQCAAQILARMAGSIAIVTVPRAASSRLKYIQLVYVQEFLVLLIAVLQGARLKQQLLPLVDPASQSELTEVANKLNDALGGLTYAEIESKQFELTPFEEVVMGDTLAILKDVDTESALEHGVDGVRLLLGQPEFAESQKVKEVVEILEERILLRSILSEATQRDTAVFIGEENREKALRPFGVVLSQYGIPEEASGTIGVIGPTRMDYASVMGGVNFLASFMSELVMGIHGKS